MVHAGSTKKRGNRPLKRYLCSMAAHISRILLIDENPVRLSSAATILILSGHSVFALDCAELRALLARGTYNWRIDLVLMRAVLDIDTETLFEEQLGRVPIRRVSPAAVLDINLPAMVDDLLAGKTPVATRTVRPA